MAEPTDAEIAAKTPEQREALRAQLRMQEMAERKAVLIAEGYTEDQIEAELAAKVDEIRTPALPAPTVTGLSQASAVVGDPDFVLSVYGTGFTDASVILFNNGEEPTTFVSEGEVTTIVKPSTASGPVVVPVSVVGAAESVSFEFTEG